MQEKPSLLMIIFGVLVCLSLCVFGFFSFYTESSRLIDGIYNHLDILVFNKGSMHFLGGGIFCLNILVASFYFFITGKQLLKSTKINNIVIFIAPLLIMLIFPHIVHGYVKSYINENSYVYCQDQSVVEYRYTKYIYAKDLNTCKTYKK